VQYPIRCGFDAHIDLATSQLHYACGQQDGRRLVAALIWNAPDTSSIVFIIIVVVFFFIITCGGRCENLPMGASGLHNKVMARRRLLRRTSEGVCFVGGAT
jgi:hypothetical protein